MEFSDIFRQNGGLCSFSPDSRFLAVTEEHRMVVREVDTMKVVLLQTCLDSVTQLNWASDSMYIMCGMAKRAVVQLRITIWSLISSHVSYVKFPKFSINQGLSFSHDGEYMAVLERSDCKDYISVFKCDSWTLVKHFPIQTSDAASLYWSPDDRFLAVVDSPLDYKLCVYYPNGQLVAEYSAYNDALGIKSCAWSPSGQFLALGSFDEKVRLLNHLTFRKISELEHPTQLKGSPTANMIIYIETEESGIASMDEVNPATTGSLNMYSRYNVHEGPYTIPCSRPDPEKPNPKMGVGLLDFSANSRFLATRNDNMADTVWVWDVAKLRLISILRQTQAVRCMAWHPERSLLAFCTSSYNVYFWSPRGTSCVRIPVDATFRVLSIRWSPAGGNLVVTDKDRFCLCYADSTMNSL